ncbi:excisionase [Micromonospora inaquosa]|uniref:Excisionase n=1 Tax=Micromonospora inaquosa TaxID=2203716 RepID=A0A3N9X4Q9_9ACTN|nr:excisionase [Micromonospora inaquosa]
MSTDEDAPSSVPLLGKPKNTLHAWHSRGKGPRAIRVGNTLRYRRSEVESWLDDHTDAER